MSDLLKAMQALRRRASMQRAGQGGPDVEIGEAQLEPEIEIGEAELEPDVHVRVGPTQYDDPHDARPCPHCGR